MAEPLPFAEVFVLHRDNIYRYCLTQVRDPAVAEDLTADTFEAAWVAYERAAPDPAWVKLWLVRIAKNHTVDFHRRNSKLAQIIRGLGRSDLGQERDVEHNVGLRDELRIALAAVAALKPRERQLIGLRVGAELSYREIGDLVGLSEHAAHVATQRAMEKVKRAVEGGA